MRFPQGTTTCNFITRELEIGNIDQNKKIEKTGKLYIIYQKSIYMISFNTKKITCTGTKQSRRQEYIIQDS
jgi:5-keto 4-deoxyuronate isomerase